jgi:subfamily B ATP-binding cassette protein MsbA
LNLYARTFSAIKPYWARLATASASAAFYAIFDGLLIWMVGPLLMTLFQAGPMSGFEAFTAPTEQVAPAIPGAPGSAAAQATGWIQTAKEGMKGFIDFLVAGENRQETLVNFCILLLAVALIKNVFYYTQCFFMSWVQQTVMKNFRDRLFAKYQRLSLDYFSARRTGQIISRVTNDVVVLNESIEVGFNRLVTDSVTLLVFSVSLLILSWELTLLAVLVMPVVFGFIWFVGKKMRKYSGRTQAKMADVNSVLEEAVNNVRIVKAFSMEDFESKKFFASTFDYFKSLVRMHRIRALASPINDILATASGAIILFYAGTKIIAGTGNLDAGDFITYLIVLFSMIKPVKSLSQIHVRLQEGMAAAERVFEVLDTDEAIKELPDAKPIERFKSTIHYDSVAFSYCENEPVLKGVSFEVHYGEVVAIVGPSGAGKSTLLDLLPRFYDPKGGCIRVDGADIRTLTLKSLRGLMGIVTQETYLFNDTIRHNIAYGQNGILMERIEEAARMANAHDFITEFEHGYDTVVGNRGIMLSGGQRQRIAIARALLKNPQILIFDEATSALDTESEALVQEAIDRLMTNRTALIIAHRLSTIKNADRILVLDRGLIVEDGSHEQLMKNDGLYKRLYMMQFKDDA